MQRDCKYEVKEVRAPRLRGIVLRLAVALLERPAVRSFLAPWLIRNLGLSDLRAAEIDEQPTFPPLHVPAGPLTPVLSGEKVAPQPRRNPGFRFRGIHDYQAAYSEGVLTPEQVAGRVLAAIASCDRRAHPLRAFLACDEEGNLPADLVNQTESAVMAKHNLWDHQTPPEVLSLDVRGPAEVEPLGQNATAGRWPLLRPRAWAVFIP